MTSILIYSIAGALLFSVGMGGMFVCTHPFRKILAMNLAGSGVFLVFLAMAQRHPDTPPDPVPQALVLTGIVVAVSATAVALALSGRVIALANDHQPPERSHGAQECETE